MDIVTAVMFGVLAIVSEKILVDFAKDAHFLRNAWSQIDWQWPTRISKG
jgi:hypothetical protein